MNIIIKFLITLNTIDTQFKIILHQKNIQRKKISDLDLNTNTPLWYSIDSNYSCLPEVKIQG